MKEFETATIIDTKEKAVKFAEECEKKSDNFTIKFTEWVISLKDSDIDSLDYHLYLNSTIKELLKEYKNL